MVPESIEVPLGHYGHASVLINEEELMIIGGVGTSDCWIFNLYTRGWKQVIVQHSMNDKNAVKQKYLVIVIIIIS